MALTELQKQQDRFKRARARMGHPIPPPCAARVPRARVDAAPGIRARPAPSARPVAVVVDASDYEKECINGDGQLHIEVIKETLKEYGVGMKELRNTGKGRNRHLINIRQEMYYRLRLYCGWSHPKIAEFFGHDHTTVMHGIKAYMRRSNL